MDSAVSVQTATLEQRVTSTSLNVRHRPVSTERALMTSTAIRAHAMPVTLVTAVTSM